MKSSHNTIMKTGETKTGATSVDEKSKFVIKDILIKKKNPQQKLEKYFKVTKPKKSQVERNFQGFPLSDCIWEEEVGQFVFRPASYYNKISCHNNGGDPSGDEEGALCRECLLRPCLVKGRWDDIMSFCEDTMIFEDDDSDAMYFKMMNHADSILVEVFGARHVRNHPTPLCVSALVGNYHDTKRGVEAAEEDPDDELVSGAVDGTDC